MRRMALLGCLVALAAMVLITGCPPAPSGSATATGTNPGAKLPTFTLAWSEYPSWSVFGVASDRGLINGEKDKTGLLEQRWGVDIELQLLDYGACMTSYTANKSDAACLTNMDSLNPALARRSVAIMPTSTSDGADALLALKTIADLDALQGKKVFGLAESVSDYAFYRLLEVNKKDPSKYKFENLDPADAAKQLASKAAGTEAIMVWNPFVLQTLRDQKDVHKLVDTKSIPEEIIDMVLVGDDVFKREKGKEFACCVAATFYEFNKMLADPAQREKLLVDLGKRFSSLNAADMGTCCEQTKFYKTPDDGIKLFTKDEYKKTMDMIVKNYMDRKILKEAPKLGYGPRDNNGEAQLIFDPSYMEMVKGKK